MHAPTRHSSHKKSPYAPIALLMTATIYISLTYKHFPQMNLPCFDLTSFLEEREQNAENLGSNFQGLSSESKNLCEGIAECFRSRGCVVVRDPRVDTAKNDDFLDLMERYFGQPEEDLLQDARPQVRIEHTKMFFRFFRRPAWNILD